MMGTFLKYLFYIVLVVVIYLVGKGVYEGQINEKTTVGEVVRDVEAGTKNMIKEGVAETDNTMENYEKTPKKEVKMTE